jgi:hypothetical protein
MNKPTVKQIKAKIKTLDKERYKINKQTNSLQDQLQRRDSEDEAVRLAKLKYAKRNYTGASEIVYIHSVRMNKKDPMSSLVKIVILIPHRNTITYQDTSFYQLRAYESAKQDEFVKAYNDLMNKIDSRLPLIKKTKVRL